MVLHSQNDFGKAMKTLRDSNISVSRVKTTRYAVAIHVDTTEDFRAATIPESCRQGFHSYPLNKGMPLYEGSIEEVTNHGRSLDIEVLKVSRTLSGQTRISRCDIGQCYRCQRWGIPAVAAEVRQVSGVLLLVRVHEEAQRWTRRKDQPVNYKGCPAYPRRRTKGKTNQSTPQVARSSIPPPARMMEPHTSFAQATAGLSTPAPIQAKSSRSHITEITKEERRLIEYPTTNHKQKQTLPPMAAHSPPILSKSTKTHKYGDKLSVSNRANHSFGEWSTLVKSKSDR
ncbi:hypothetical protein FQR65_LT06378 [Abscondita terminalis]|nr:hypothetical protein FQR65_LT06378 [Abscondita terminalis]